LTDTLMGLHAAILSDQATEPADQAAKLRKMAAA
jgi:hypothetical protein